MLALAMPQSGAGSVWSGVWAQATASRATATGKERDTMGGSLWEFNQEHTSRAVEYSFEPVLVGLGLARQPEASPDRGVVRGLGALPGLAVDPGRVELAP